MTATLNRELCRCWHMWTRDSNDSWYWMKCQLFRSILFFNWIWNSIFNHSIYIVHIFIFVACFKTSHLRIHFFLTQCSATVWWTCTITSSQLLVHIFKDWSILPTLNTVNLGSKQNYFRFSKFSNSVDDSG